ncbi:MAG: hypothetical protein JNJ52_13895 [Flavobacterium sp.]|nr:hypothetical protein [Flavobacterium sp.]
MGNKKLYLITISFIFISVLVCFGQKRKIEILKNKLNSKNKLEVVKAYNKLAFLGNDYNIIDGLEKAKKGLELSKKYKFTEEEAIANLNISMYLRSEFKYDSAFVLIEKTYKKLSSNKFQKNNSFLFRYHFEKGMIFLPQGNKEDALTEFFKAYKYAKITKDTIGIYYSGTGISSTYNNLKMFDKGMIFNNELINLAKKSKDTVILAKVFNNISASYLNLGKIKQSEYYSKQFEKLLPLVENSYLNFIYHYNKAYQLMEINDLVKSIFHSKEAVKYCKKSKRNYDLANSYYLISYLYNIKNQFDESRKYTDSTIQIATKINAKEQKLYAFSNYGEIDYKLNNFKSSSENYSNALELFQEISNDKIKTNSNFLAVKYQTEKKNLQIQNLQTLSKKRFWISIALAFGIIGIGGIAFSQFKNYKTKKALLLAEQDKAVAEERLRIATDMHDDVGTGLSRILYITNSVKTGETSKEEGLSKVTEISDDTITKMSEIIWALNESNQTLEELIYFIRSQASEMVENAKLNFEGILPETIPNLSFGWMRNRNTYLLAKETINNAIKHAQAKTIRIQFEIKDQLIITIKDDGIGFDTNKKFNGNGLNNYKKRIEKLGGKHTIISSKNEGTIIVYQIPLI